MTRHILLLYLADRPQPGTPEGDELFEAIRAFYAECRDRGVLVASDPLLGPETATSVRVRGGRRLTTDGPFAETTEWLGGYFILDCTTREEALELAALCPTALTGTVEVREIMGR